MSAKDILPKIVIDSMIVAHRIERIPETGRAFCAALMGSPVSATWTVIGAIETPDTDYDDDGNPFPTTLREIVIAPRAGNPDCISPSNLAILMKNHGL